MKTQRCRASAAETKRKTGKGALRTALLLLLVLLASCRDDEYVYYSEDVDTGVASVESEIIGMYVLNEGNMGSNKCTLDFLNLSPDSATIHYTRDIYSECNPSEVKELGDVGNDVKVYGSRLWMVVNVSNKVVVTDAYSCVKIGQVDIANCRNLAFDGDYAYISSYAGPVTLGGTAQLGRVYKVDTLTLEKVDSVTVGYQPEELCIIDDKLYVANSGGYRATGDYDRTVSVVDLQTFGEERQIDVAINLHRCRADSYGQLWVTSRGNYSVNAVPSRLFCLTDDGSGMQLVDSVDITVSDLCIVGDSLYYIGVDQTNTTSNGTITYGIVDVTTRQVVSTALSEADEIAAIKVPYGIMVNPIDRDFYIMDARDYVSSGRLYHFLADGTFEYYVTTGDIPGHAAFLYK